MTEVAQRVFDGPEDLVVGQIDEAFGHLAEGLVGLGAEPVEEGLDAGFAAFGGR